MILRDWCDLPQDMQHLPIRSYYDVLHGKKYQLFIKFLLDRIIAGILLILLLPILFVLAICIKMDSPGEIFFRQKRITRYGKEFYIYKFRTMVQNAESVGAQVTSDNDARITKVGRKIRDLRLDELPQLINILQGDMTFVGTRPEVPKYVAQYTEEMRATLLMPAGVTSEASISYKDESRLLEDAVNVDDVYINKVLPEKMKLNLLSLQKFNLATEFLLMLKTVRAVL